MRRPIVLLCALLLASSGCDGGSSSSGAEPTPSPQEEPPEDYAESSGSFDPEAVQPFLERLASSLERGFGTVEIAQVSDALKALAADEEAEFEFPVTFQGESVPLDLSVSLDDDKSPALYFFTSPALAAHIDELMDQYAKELQEEPAQPPADEPPAPGPAEAPTPGSAPTTPAPPSAGSR